MMEHKLKNDLILRALKQEPVERIPVWLMRQAGRYLPEYQKLRSAYSFWERCRTPELSCEITMQPVRRLGVDAAILFSDILVVPQAMGMEITFNENEGPRFPSPIRSMSDLKKLRQPEVKEELAYVTDAIRLVKKELNGSVPLIGFAGAPWTIFCYMVQSSGSKNFNEAKRLFYTSPESAHTLLQLITSTTISYVKEQIESGVDVIQLFDSWAGLLNENEYSTLSLPYINQIVQAIEDKVPTIVFAKGAWHSLGALAKSAASALGVDYTVSAAYAKAVTEGNSITLQGNLEPAKLYGSPDFVREETTKMLKDFGKHPYIANLGHGILPDTPIESVQAFVETIKNYNL